MPITQLNKCRKIQKKCTSKNKKEKRKNYSMLDKFKDKKNKEENKEHQMLKIN